MKKIIILGSTGNLGQQMLEVYSDFKDSLKVVGISGHSQSDVLIEQAKKYGVELENLLIGDLGEGAEMKIRLNNLIEKSQPDAVINLLSGIAGLVATKLSLEKGIPLITGNKESLIADPEFAAAHRKNIIPIDSEHSAIFEVLKSRAAKKPVSFLLPCSGGPFFGKNTAELKTVTVSDALAHPKWKMGAKVSVESATLINKAFEVIEAMVLFGVKASEINVKIHPSCKLHGAVEFEDGEVVGYLGSPDMKEHLAHAINHFLHQSIPEAHIKPINLEDFDLYPADYKTFPSIPLIVDFWQKNWHDPARLQEFLKTEEQVVKDFLEGRIKFLEIVERLNVNC